MSQSLPGITDQLQASRREGPNRTGPPRNNAEDPDPPRSATTIDCYSRVSQMVQGTSAHWIGEVRNSTHGTERNATHDRLTGTAGFMEESLR